MRKDTLFVASSNQITERNGNNMNEFNSAVTTDCFKPSPSFRGEVISTLARFNYPRITYRQAMAIGYITLLLTSIKRSNAELNLAKFFVDLVFRCISLNKQLLFHVMIHLVWRIHASENYTINGKITAWYLLGPEQLSQPLLTNSYLDIFHGNLKKTKKLNNCRRMPGFVNNDKIHHKYANISRQVDTYIGITVRTCSYSLVWFSWITHT